MDTITDLARFERMSRDDIQLVQVKLTYVGEQEKATPSVIVTTAGQEISMDAFAPFRRAGVNYGNDRVVAFQVCPVNAGELRFMLAAITRTCREQPAPASPAFLSVTLLHTAGNGPGCETILDPQKAGALLRVLPTGLEQHNTKARAILGVLQSRVFGV